MAELNSESLHEAVRRSLMSGDFETACGLSVELGKAITREASGLPETERNRQLQRSLSRLQEHLSLTCVLRAHVASQLQTNTAVCRYETNEEGQACWGFDA